MSSSYKDFPNIDDAELEEMAFDEADEEQGYPAFREKARHKRIQKDDTRNRLNTKDKVRKKQPTLDIESEDEVESRARAKPRYKQTSEEVFKCRHCRRFVTPVPSGGQHRNHCPFCLYSRHVDDKHSGDRMSDCGASMEPIGYFQRNKGEYVLVHRCLGCGFERFNRIAGDDDFDLVLSLPEVAPRTRSEMKAQRWEAELS